MGDQDREDQFQEDLAKALALSLETAAMETLRREDCHYNKRSFVNVPQGMYNMKINKAFNDIIVNCIY